IEESAREHQIDPDVAEEVVGVYRALSDTRGSAIALAGELRTNAALTVLADREQEFYSDHFEGRTVSRAGAQTLLAHAERLRDRTRGEGVAGYRQAAARLGAFDFGFRVANSLHRRFGMAGTLAQRLADRFEVLLATRTVLHKLIRFNHEQIGELF